MAQFATRVTVLAFLWLALAGPVMATSSLSFEGGGYWIDLEIGADHRAAVASVRFHPPGDTKGVVLPRSDWQVETFDSERQLLVLQHKGDHSGVAPFKLSVQQHDAVLTIAGREIHSSFSWGQ